MSNYRRVYIPGGMYFSWWLRSADNVFTSSQRFEARVYRAIYTKRFGLGKYPVRRGSIDFVNVFAEKPALAQKWL